MIILRWILERYGMDWIPLAKDREKWRDAVNKVMKLRDPYNIGKFLSGWTSGGLYRRAQLHGVGSSSLLQHGN
jgi:hypothetical protein